MKRPALKRTVTTHVVTTWELVWEDVEPAQPTAPAAEDTAPAPGAGDNPTDAAEPARPNEPQQQRSSSMPTKLTRILRPLGHALLVLGLAAGASGAPFQAEAAPGQQPAANAGAATTAPLALGLAGQYGGGVLTAAVEGNRAYVGRGPRLEIYDLTDPAAPVLLGQSAVMPGYVQELVVSSGYAYVAANWGGLRVLDVTDPAAPVEIAAIAIDNAANAVSDVELSSEKLYVGSYGRATSSPRGGLSIYHLDDPGAPQFVGGWYYPASVAGLAVANDVAYLALGISGVRPIDVSNPAQPVALPFVDTFGVALDIALDGNYAYVADLAAGLTVLNVADPASASAVGNVPIPTSGRDVDQSGGYAYVATDGGVRVYDLSDPELPDHVESVFSTAPTHDVDALGGRLYLATGEGGLLVASVADPVNALPLGTTGPAENTLAVAVAGTLSGPAAFLANNSAGLSIVGVTDPAAPLLLGRRDTDGWPQGIAVAGIRAYTASWTRMHVFNVSNPQAPAPPAVLAPPGAAFADVHVNAGYAYLANYTNGLTIASLSNPASPTVTGTVDTPGSALGVVVSSTYAYVADRYNGLQIVDVSEPWSPAIVGAYDTDGEAWGVAVRGTHAFVADRLRGLVILKISNPIEPSLVGSVVIGGEARWVALRGDYAFVANGSFGVAVVDISDLTQPRLVSRFQTAHFANRVAVDENYVYVADSYGGLFILHELTEHVYLPLVSRGS